MTEAAPDPFEAAFATAANVDSRESRFGSRPAYLVPGSGSTAQPGVSAATASRPAARPTSTATTPSSSIIQPEALTLADLANRPIWVGWRQETRDADLTKLPYDPKTGRLAASDNASTWATRNEAQGWVATQRGDGVGIMLRQLDGGTFLCGVDLDTCRTSESDDIAPWAQEIIDRLMTYTEVSPSGTGAKAFFTVASADLAAVETLFDGKHGRSFKKGNGKHPPAIEIYRGRRYFAVTGESCGPTDYLRCVDLADLRWLICDAGPKFAVKSRNGRDDSRSAKAWRAGAALKASGASYEAMRDALLGHEDSGVADWARSKGLANDEREMCRIYDKGRCAGDAEFLRSGEIKASPFVWIDPAAIPRRQWLYGRHNVRKFISETVAPGAYGKSTLAMTEALAIVTGRPLLGVTPDEQANVWYWNGEDPMEELQRRIVAACLHYQIDRSEIEGRLFVDTGRKTKIIIADQTKTGARVARPIVDQVIETIRCNEIGLMIVDPFVASHRVVENDNPAIELVAGVWAEIADLTGCAIELVHHARKTGGAEITVDDGRGASALLAKARSARTLNGMSEDEAARAGVDCRRSFFRVQNGKSNLSPAADQADWYRLVSVDLANGGCFGLGDSVGVVARWTWPNALDGVTGSDLREVQATIAGGRWRKDSQAKDWAGHAIAAVLKLNVSNKAHRAKIVALLKTWIADGKFVVVEGLDAKRERRSFIEVGTPVGD
jgi:AAA domain